MFEILYKIEDKSGVREYHLSNHRDQLEADLALMRAKEKGLSARIVYTPD